MGRYADIRGERITFTLCIVQLYYVNSLLLLCAGLQAWLYTRIIYFLSCRFGLVINLPAEYVVSVLLCMPVQDLCVCVCGDGDGGGGVIAASTQGHLERLRETKDINNASKY